MLDTSDPNSPNSLAQELRIKDNEEDEEEFVPIKDTAKTKNKRNSLHAEMMQASVFVSIEIS